MQLKKKFERLIYCGKKKEASFNPFRTALPFFCIHDLKLESKYIFVQCSTKRLLTTLFVLPRAPTPASGTPNTWGDQLSFRSWKTNKNLRSCVLLYIFFDHLWFCDRCLYGQRNLLKPGRVSRRCGVHEERHVFVIPRRQSLESLPRPSKTGRARIRDVGIRGVRGRGVRGTHTQTGRCPTR